MSKDLQKEFDKAVKIILKECQKGVKQTADYLKLFEKALKYSKLTNSQRKSK